VSWSRGVGSDLAHRRRVANLEPCQPHSVEAACAGRLDTSSRASRGLRWLATARTVARRPAARSVPGHWCRWRTFAGPRASPSCKSFTRPITRAACFAGGAGPRWATCLRAAPTSCIWAPVPWMSRRRCGLASTPTRRLRSLGIRSRTVPRSTKANRRNPGEAQLALALTRCRATRRGGGGADAQQLTQQREAIGLAGAQVVERDAEVDAVFPVDHARQFEFDVAAG
jgi:hypothetical protein